VVYDNNWLGLVAIEEQEKIRNFKISVLGFLRANLFKKSRMA
jgi:hypothetical protein